MSYAFWEGVSDGSRGSNSNTNRDSWDSAAYKRGQQFAQEAKDRSKQEEEHFKRNYDRWMNADSFKSNDTSSFQSYNFTDNNISNYHEPSSQNSYCGPSSPVEDEDFRTRYEYYKRHGSHVLPGGYETSATRQFEERYRMDKEKREGHLKPLNRNYLYVMGGELKPMIIIDCNTSISYEERLKKSQKYFKISFSSYSS